MRNRVCEVFCWCCSGIQVFGGLSVVFACGRLGISMVRCI